MQQQLKIPPIAAGERYIGCIGDAAGNQYHVILLPGDNDADTWEDQVDWAKSIGGGLPNRVEQAMLWAKAPDVFDECAYWSNEEYADARAWVQYFDSGYQRCYHKGYELRARAVRRVFIYEV